MRLVPGLAVAAAAARLRRRRDRPVAVPPEPNGLPRALDGVVVVNLSAEEAELAPDSETLDPWQIKVGGRES
jgi:hypothetical protein